jgi:hypothetical protein
MAQKSSTFVQQTRERETWLTSGDGIDPKEAEQSMAVAAMTRGVLESIPVPEEAEERSRVRALAELDEIIARHEQTQIRAPWYLRLGHALRYVFTFGKRR